MPNFSYKLVFMSAFLIIGSTIGGWALTQKIADAEAAYSFLVVGGGAVSFVLVLQLIFYFPGKKRLLYQILFAISYTASAVWFLMCLFLPLFWVGTISVYTKLFIVLVMIPLCACNYMLAIRQFSRKWKEKGEENFAKFYDANNCLLDWQKVVSPMKLRADLYLPGIPSRATPTISAIMTLSMLLGLNLRKVFPIFSVFAWGIPCAVGISILVQMAGLWIAQLSKIRELEKATGREIRPKA